MSEKCTEYGSLEKEVADVLKQLTQITTDQLAAFRAQDNPEFKRLDKQLELTVGRKERIIGALRQHAKDHGCRT